MRAPWHAHLDGRAATCCHGCMRFAAAALLALSLLGLAGCKRDAPVLAGRRYLVQVDAAAPSRVRVTPTEGWKINLEYPNRLEVKTQPAGAALEIKDAKVTDREV